jgi:hypothetical protein
MANDNFTFNACKGEVKSLAALPAANDALIVVLLKLTGLQADLTLADYTDLAALLAASNDECDFTNYTRKTLTGVTNTVDNANNWLDTDAVDFTYAAAGGATNNSIGKALICYDGDTTAGTDANIRPMTAHAFTATTDGNDLVVTIATGGFWRGQDLNALT